MDLDHLAGTTLGPCRLEELVGAGGMGAVYRARHLRLDRDVAVKVLAPSLYGGAADDARFLREAQLAAKLEDDRIVTVYDVGIENSLRYIIMAYVRGVTLSQAVRAKGRLSCEEAHRVMREVLLALSAAHKANIVHRDVKPGNIVVDAAGKIKLMDFGAAAARTENPDPEQNVIGTLEYMPPDQAFGGAPDPRMDLYAWGCTYYYALTGKPPYTGTPGQLLAQHRESSVPDVRDVNQEVSPAAAALIASCMAKFPDQRPESAEKILAGLDQPGFVLQTQSTGSPFKLLPPPPESLQALRKPGAAAAPEPVGLIPPPPPALDIAAARPSLVTAAIFAGLYAFFFGRPWFSAVPADWPAAVIVAAGLACSLALVGPLFRRRLIGPLLWVAMLAGAAGAAGDPSAAGAEVLILAALAAATSLAGIYVAFLEQAPDGRSGAFLIALGAAGLLCAAAAAHAGANPWSQAIPAWLASSWADWTATGGAWRWGGLLALYAAYATARLSRSDVRDWARKTTADGRVIDWNK